jgi:predicted nucleic acid-binding protein
MSARSFFDTNILAYTDDKTAQVKQHRALDLFEEHRQARTGVVSLQILQEYFVTLTRKFGMDASAARSKTELVSKLHVVVFDERDILAAIDLHRLYHFSLWDALVIRAAKQGGCKTVFSEDWQHGQEIEGVRIVNPFVSHAR